MTIAGHRDVAGEALTGAALAAASTVRLEVEIVTLGTDAHPPRQLVPLFHELIREQALDDLLIDVADYSHVPDGPGVLLVGHDATIGYRDTLGGDHGRRSLVYSRRRESWRPVAEPTPARRLRAALRNVWSLAVLLEERLGERIRFDSRLFEVTLNDRLQSPQGDATRLAWRPEVEAVAGEVHPDVAVRISDRGEDPRERVGFRVQGGPWAEPLASLLARVR